MQPNLSMRASRRDHAMIDNPDNTERLIVIVPVGLSRYQRYAGALNRE